IDEHTLTYQWDQLRKDPFPIYAVMDKQCKQEEDQDPWFEISPLEAGYSLTGAFVETSSFGSQFCKGSKKKDHPETDMLYLQALCGSVLADGDEIKKFLWKKIKDFFQHLIPTKEMKMLEKMSEALFLSICRCMTQWIWGRKYNFLHKMTDETVPAALLEGETRDYIDAGLLLNSPYFSVLREERDIDLIISLDFSESDPFK
ncbi:hypothetical protein cypCar_00042392, partial [Cyprinus carpio]